MQRLLGLREGHGLKAVRGDTPAEPVDPEAHSTSWAKACAVRVLNILRLRIPNRENVVAGARDERILDAAEAPAVEIDPISMRVHAHEPAHGYVFGLRAVLRGRNPQRDLRRWQIRLVRSELVRIEVQVVEPHILDAHVSHRLAVAGARLAVLAPHAAGRLEDTPATEVAVVAATA